MKSWMTWKMEPEGAAQGKGTLGQPADKNNQVRQAIIQSLNVWHGAGYESLQPGGKGVRFSARNCFVGIWAESSSFSSRQEDVWEENSWCTVSHGIPTHRCVHPSIRLSLTKSSMLLKVCLSGRCRWKGIKRKVCKSFKNSRTAAPSYSCVLQDSKL